jgi:hypothetical protein
LGDISFTLKFPDDLKLMEGNPPEKTQIKRDVKGTSSKEYFSFK